MVRKRIQEGILGNYLMNYSIEFDLYLDIIVLIVDIIVLVVDIVVLIEVISIENLLRLI